MRHGLGRTVVVSLGGSVVCPDGVDARFLRRFRRFLVAELRKGRKFVLVVGGGSLSRTYQKTAASLGITLQPELDWIGIRATYVNAELVRGLFGRFAAPSVFHARSEIRYISHPVTIVSGWKPGWSTDYVTVAVAKKLKIPEVVMAGKPAYVYPHTKRESLPARRGHGYSRSGVGVYDANTLGLDVTKPFEHLSWREYRKLIPKKWTSGFHAPVDPVAARFAKQHRMTAIVVYGRDLKNFANLLNGREFRGTIIQDADSPR